MLPIYFQLDTPKNLRHSDTNNRQQATTSRVSQYDKMWCILQSNNNTSIPWPNSVVMLQPLGPHCSMLARLLLPHVLEVEVPPDAWIESQQDLNLLVRSHPAGKTSKILGLY